LLIASNANRAAKNGLITPDNLEPISKNPIIATFFRNIGRADRLGSGVRNLFKYSRFYSGQDPQLSESDVFRIIVPLDETYSYDYEFGRNGSSSKMSRIQGMMQNKTQEKTQEMTQEKTQEMTQDTLRTILDFCVVPRSKQEILVFCGHKSKKWFTKNYIAPLLKSGKLRMTIPDKPNSRNQKYIVDGQKKMVDDGKAELKADNRQVER